MFGALLMLGAAGVPAAGAQPVRELAVDEWVALALGGNPELRAARTEVEAAAARVQQAALRPNPMLDLGGQKAISPDNNLTIGLTVPLDLNGRKEAESEWPSGRSSYGARRFPNASVDCVRRCE